MQNFDEARDVRLNADRTFQLGHETLVRQPGVHPTVMFAYEDMKAETGAAEAYEIVVGLVYAFVEPEYHPKLDALLSVDNPHPVTISDLNTLVQWLIRETTGRPTTAPSPSTAGRETPQTGTPSTDSSSSEQAAASAA
jgi:hypothetical protein